MVLKELKVNNKEKQDWKPFQSYAAGLGYNTLILRILYNAQQQKAEQSWAKLSKAEQTEQSWAKLSKNWAKLEVNKAKRLTIRGNASNSGNKKIGSDSFLELPPATPGS